MEVPCGACKGRFNSETLDVTLRGKTIDDVLNMSVEEGVEFFAGEPAVGKKIEVLQRLGLGYLTHTAENTRLRSHFPTVDKPDFPANRMRVVLEGSLIRGGSAK